MKKKIILLIFVNCINFFIYSQISIENTYPNTGWCKGSIVNGNLMYGQRQLYLIHLETSGDKYVDINKMNQTIDFYNIDHTLWKSIDYSSVSIISPYPENQKSQCSILYISQLLFNTDENIEFLYTYSWYNGSDTTWHAITQIVSENGTMLFTRNAAPLIQPAWHAQYFPIYNTTEGTKMILSNESGTAEVFSLGGNFTPGISQNNIQNQLGMSLFPNPSAYAQMITINYQLPDQNKSAELIIFDALGKRIKTFTIGNGLNTILVDTIDLSSGMYFYTIKTENGEILANKKSILIK
ncbi:MAG: T9SS type A sorting domain-containing protein [Bacteroidia bacterium]|jgi:hypothetical protein